MHAHLDEGQVEENLGSPSNREEGIVNSADFPGSSAGKESTCNAGDSG